MNTIRKKDYTMHRWFAFALLVIFGLIHWINGLYHDLDDVKFNNDIYQIRFHDYDSIIVEKNHKIDSLINLTTKPVVSAPTPLPKKFVVKKDTINKDTILNIKINTDTTITINDTIK